MKVKFLHVYFSFFLLAVAVGFAQAQPRNESLPPPELQDPSHQELNLDDDKTLLFDQESRSKTAQKDSVLITTKSTQALLVPGKSKSEPGKSGKDEDDALSFNFLFYIIQKFKISDLIDE